MFARDFRRNLIRVFELSVEVVFLLIWCDVVLSLQFDHLILYRLNVYAWFGGSGARDFLEVSWTSTFDLGKRSTRYSSSWLNAYAWFENAEHVMFLKLESLKKVCIFKWADLRGKLESYKKSCIFKEASIFDDGLRINLVSSKKLQYSMMVDFRS